MALKVSIAPRAAGDLRTIRDYLMSRSLQGADSVRAAIDATLMRLSEFPRAGRDRPELGVRSIGVPRYSYTVYYHIETDEVVVVHVRDDRRRPLRASEL